MPGPDISGNTLIGRDWTKSVALVVVCIGLVAAAIYGVQLEPDSYRAQRFHQTSFLILPIFSVFGLFAIYRLVIPWGAPVRLSPEGFLDLRAGRRIIPWPEITNVRSASEFVTLTLGRRFRKTYQLSWTQSLLKKVRKSAGPNHLVVADWCLATTPGDLAEAIQAYRAAHSGNPESR
ncbi:hypothetical protein [Tropicimonas sp. IMCC6043]|uniref:hypothetical protein n=1 Tax=Tropicimonas sp. IMCC6043 TaxID=2510645 RepID=UPI00101C0C24|nr:hypothetical protein [Tropicimonas sp. IMCC6043]RYH09942.1 hypothetical protein EU800_10345 [Tropicimonas sp. IMCC6043]